MQAVRDFPGFSDDGQQRTLCQREIRSNRGVVGIARGVVGNQQIVAVVSAEQENTYQRLVTAGGGGRGQGVNHVQAPEGRGHAE